MELQEYFSPTFGWKPYQKEFGDYPLTDYAEIELVPNEDDLNILENLDRYASRAMFTEEELKEIDDQNNDAYEHMIAYVHFYAGTERFQRMHLEVITAYDSAPLVVGQVIDKETQEKVKEEALKSIRKWRDKNASTGDST